MISKKRAAFLIVIISVTVGIVFSILTYTITVNQPNKDGEIYLSGEEYRDYLRLYQVKVVNDLIDDNYYQNVDEDVLMTGALKGMVAALDDPYSAYYTKEEFQAFDESYEGSYTGVGMLVTKDKDDGYLTVLHVFADSPAAEAEILSGDKIISVDDKGIADVDIETAAGWLKGPEGTKVTVMFERAGERFTKEMVRKPVEIDRLTFSMIDADIGFINIFEFSGNCVEKFEEAKAFMAEEQAKGVVIDLRGNPGGFMNHVTRILDDILPEGKLVYTIGKEGEQTDVRMSDADCWDMPLVVLVNEYSASASEIFAGAIQDYHTGAIVGTTTYGKGVVQSIIEIPETGTGVKLTTSMYYTPEGRSINGIGIYPDYYVELPAEVIKDPSMFSEETDTQLNKAVEVLLETIRDKN